MSQKPATTDRKKGAKSLMSRNVTEFRHLLSKNYVNQHDLEWTMGLRDINIPKTIERKDPVAPEVFFKKTALETIRGNIRSKEKLNVVHANEYDYMVAKQFEKGGPKSPKQTIDQLHFYQSIRRDGKLKGVGSASHKQFNCLPKKDRNQFPTFIRKEHIKKTGGIGRQEVQSAFDGAQNQQPYTNKMRTRNYGFFQPMVKAKGRSKVALPAIAWQMGLRGY